MKPAVKATVKSPATPPWTEDRLILLRKLWAQGETAAAIGRCLGGLTRSAVLGKVFRLRLDAGAAAASAGQGARESAIAPAPKRRRRSPVRASKPPRAAPPPSRPPAPAPAKPRGKSLLELTHRSCRWPHGRPGSKTFFFCGVDEADLELGMPYCPLHAQRAYVAGQATKNAPSVTWSTLRAVFAPAFEQPRLRAAAASRR